MPFRNIETHFSTAPQVNVRRSKFKYNRPCKLTFNAGELVPFLVEEVLPGDTFNLKTSKVVRLTTSIHPTMDNLYIDTYYFFVPNRLIWDNWQAFMGENDKAWTQNISHVPPMLQIGGQSGDFGSSYRNGLVDPQSLLQYLGLPAFAENSKKVVDVTSLDLNAYMKIWNDWFRSENLVDECPIYTGDGYIPKSYQVAYVNFLNSNFGINKAYNDGGSCLPVAKFADYFTRALPQPQKGADVLIPAAGDVLFNAAGYDSTQPPTWMNASGMNDGTDSTGFNNLKNQPVGEHIDTLGTPTRADYTIGTWMDSTQTFRNERLAYDPAGTLSLSGLEITVNNLRLAMQTQKLLERDARGGTRYIEIIKSHFGVVSPDARLQRSEYLGGKRTLINMSEVIQTSESSATSPLGNLAGRSVTSDVEDSFIKSFVEHGYIVGVMCVRPDRTYSQGIPRRYFRTERLAYYYPVLANIGEQPIFEREIFMPGSSESIDPDDVFGYQEAWAEYRTQQGRTTGFLQPGISGSLDSWTYADNYLTSPILSASWLYQGKSEIDRTLAIPSATAPQFIADMLTFGNVTRPMPIYSVPGLVDHN